MTTYEMNVVSLSILSINILMQDTGLTFLCQIGYCSIEYFCRWGKRFSTALQIPEGGLQLRHLRASPLR